MIYDTLDNASQYFGINKGLDSALKAMAAFTPKDYKTGRVDIDGDNVFLMPSAYKTHGMDGALMEAHRQYIDVMYMVEGEETVYVKPTARLSCVVSPYDPAVEALLAKVDSDAVPIRLEAGSFLVLFPQDAHCPACNVSGECRVKKVIGKVRVAEGCTD